MAVMMTSNMDTDKSKRERKEDLDNEREIANSWLIYQRNYLGRDIELGEKLDQSVKKFADSFLYRLDFCLLKSPDKGTPNESILGFVECRQRCKPYVNDTFPTTYMSMHKMRQAYMDMHFFGIKVAIAFRYSDGMVRVFELSRAKGKPDNLKWMGSREHTGTQRQIKKGDKLIPDELDVEPVYHLPHIDDGERCHLYNYKEVMESNDPMINEAVKIFKGKIKN